MSDTPLVEVERRGEVAILRLRREATGNALDTAMCSAITAALAGVEEDAARAVVIIGEGRFFSTGGDLATLREWHTWPPLQRRDWLSNGPQSVNRALVACRLPTVAAVNGPAFGAGLDLALSCDLRVAATDARLCTAYANLGVIPGDGGSWLLTRSIGTGPAMDLLLTGRVIDADEALRLGLVARVADDALAEALTLAELVGGKPGGVAAHIRQAVHASATQSFVQHLEYAGLLMASVSGSKAHADAVAELERRR